MTAAAATEIDLSARLSELEEENEHLRRALKTRVVVEQAKGVLAARLRMKPDETFDVLRHAARDNRIRLYDLAQRCVDEPRTPELVLEALRRPRPARR